VSIIHTEWNDAVKICSQEIATPCPCKPNVVHVNEIKSVEKRLHVAGLSKELQHALVRAKHDGSAGNDTEHVRYQSAIERCHAFFLPDELEALCEAGVLEVAVLLRGLSQSCSDNLVRICDERCNKFGTTSGGDLARPVDCLVPKCGRPPARSDSLCTPCQS
jgi:hypothetical protein